MSSDIYFAPLEGITGHVYRRTFEKHFGKGKVTKYFTPFIVPKKKTFLTTKERMDLLPENNRGITLVPQILTNHAEGFLQMTQALTEQGYDTWNINLGCPSGTVVSKGRGSGFLSDLQGMEAFFSDIMGKTKGKVSIKTRIGRESHREIEGLVSLFNQFQFEEWIIHSRVREDFYKNKPDLEAFSYALENSTNPVVYNGDIFRVKDYMKIKKRFPNVKAVMCGRGFVANPGLAGEIYGEMPMTKGELKAFLADVLRGYGEVLSGEKDILFRMKELWSYMISMFSEPEKDWKRIRKSRTLSEYQNAVEHLFEICSFTPSGGFCAD